MSTEMTRNWGRILGGPKRARRVPLWRAVFQRVIIDQVRDGRLRTDDWTPGLRGVGVVTLLMSLVAVGLTLATGLIRSGTDLAMVSEISIPLPVIPPAFVVCAVALSLVIAGLLHAPWPLRLVAVVAGLSSFASVSFTVADLQAGLPSRLLLTAATLLVLTVVWRWTRPPRWWEPPLVCAVMAMGILGPVWLSESELRLEVISLSLLIFLLGTIAAAPTIVAAFGVVDFALSTSLWVADLAGDRVSVRIFRGVVIVGGLGVVALLIPRWLGQPRAMSGLVASLGLLVVVGGLCRVADLVADRRSAGQTDVHHFGASHNGAVWLVGLSVGGLLFLEVALLPLWALFERWSFADRPAWAVWGERRAVVAWGLAAVGCLAVGCVAAWRARRGVAEFALGLIPFLVVNALRTAGVVRVPWTPGGLAVVTASITMLVVIVWVLTRRFTRERAEAGAALFMLSAAIALPDVLGDPVGALLGAAGSGLVLFGVAWNLLTGSTTANGDSPRFPRQARVLLTLGLALVVLLHVLFATVIRGGGVGDTLDLYSAYGSTLVGPAFLLVVWLALISGALAGRSWRAPPG
ncbi:MAG: hypothetical protein Q4G46_09895 [Propionibacteriaceae bacterium]|nr:hypothetical protein [Propionibacteriaceae bacterium]